MADTPNVVRPEPRPDAAAVYRPLSALAVGALLVAGFGAVIIAILGIAARASSKPVLYPIALALPIAGVALALAAKWHIRQAQGTRVGSGLAGAALWLGILFGGGYAAYYFATEFAVQQQAKATADQFFALLARDEIEKAFRATLHPAQQLTIREDDKEGIRRRFGAHELASFERSDLVRQCRVWKDKMEAVRLGVRGMEVLPTGYQIELDYRVLTPEGHLYVGVTTNGVDDPNTGARVWQVMFNRSGIRDRRVTMLGRLYQELQYASINYLKGWVMKVYNGQTDVAGLLQVSGKPPDAAKSEQLHAQLKTVGSLMVLPGNLMFPPPPPMITATADGIEITHIIDVRLPAIAEVNTAMLTVRVTDAKLHAELMRLLSGDWKQQPILENAGEVSELGRYQPDFKVTLVNVLPDAPRPAPRTEGDGP